MLTEQLNLSAQIFQQGLRNLKYNNQVVQLPSSTRKANGVAAAIGCRVEQIAKTIIFRTIETEEPILLITFRTYRINRQSIEVEIGDAIQMANANFVKKKTGYAIGGVPPFGHTNPITTFLDEDLFQFDTVWAAGGHKMAVFETTAEELVDMTGAKVINVK